MKRILFAAFICSLFVACAKDSGSIVKQASKFSYSTVKEVLTPMEVLNTAKSLAAVDILDNDGNIIATNLLRAIPVVVANSAKLSARVSQLADDQFSRAYFPAQGEYATMMFEDLFPSKGDYDMNDAVIGFNYEFVLAYDAEIQQDMVHALIVKIVPRAVGAATQTTPIGIALSINAANVLLSSVGRTHEGELDNGLFVLDGKIGIESMSNFTDQTVVPLTGNLRSHFTTSEAGSINVKTTENIGKEFVVTINLDKKIAYKDFTIFGVNPRKYNIDLFAVFKSRGREVHMKGMKPTTKFDSQYFVGTDAAFHKDFSTKDNYIWALMVPANIKHPIETRVDERDYIEKAYPEFAAWVLSNGATNDLWYKNPNSEYCYNISY